MRAIDTQSDTPSTVALDQENPPGPDGRGARSQRTRDSVVDALLVLVRQGNFRPTAREISDEAGTSLRSVYVHFDDLEDLFCAAAERQGATVAHLMEPLENTGEFADRLNAFVVQHERIWEAVAPVWLAAKLQEPFSPSLAAILLSTRKRASRYFRHVFAGEIENLPADRTAPLIRACESLASTATWDQWRRLEGRSIRDCHDILINGLTALLVGQPTFEDGVVESPRP